MVALLGARQIQSVFWSQVRRMPPAGVAVFGEETGSDMSATLFQPAMNLIAPFSLLHLGSVIVALIHFHFLFILVHGVIVIVVSATL